MYIILPNIESLTYTCTCTVHVLLQHSEIKPGQNYDRRKETCSPPFNSSWLSSLVKRPSYSGSFASLHPFPGFLILLVFVLILFLVFPPYTRPILLFIFVSNSPGPQHFQMPCLFSFFCTCSYKLQLHLLLVFKN